MPRNRLLNRELGLHVTLLLPIRNSECMYFFKGSFLPKNIIVRYKPVFCSRLAFDFFFSKSCGLIRLPIDWRPQLAIDLLSGSKIQHGGIGRSTVPSGDPTRQTEHFVFFIPIFTIMYYLRETFAFKDSLLLLCKPCWILYCSCTYQSRGFSTIYKLVHCLVETKVLLS